MTQGILGGIFGGNSVSAGMESGASAIASNVITDQVQKALKDGGLNVDPKGHTDATFANILTQAVATGIGALGGSEVSSLNVWTADRPKPDTVKKPADKAAVATQANNGTQPALSSDSKKAEP